MVRLLVKLRAVAAVESDLVNGPKQHSNKKKQRKRSHDAHLNGCRMIGKVTREGLRGSGGACLSAIGPAKRGDVRPSPCHKPLPWVLFYAAHTPSVNRRKPSSVQMIRGVAFVSAEIIRLDDFRLQPANDDIDCDMVTAIDVAIRDLREILQFWGSEGARARTQECERMLTRVFNNGVTSSPVS